MTKRIETFHIDGGAYNHGAWAVIEVEGTIRVGTITEPMTTTYMEGNTFKSVDANGANAQLHKTWEEAVARFQ